MAWIGRLWLEKKQSLLGHLAGFWDTALQNVLEQSENGVSEKKKTGFGSGACFAYRYSASLPFCFSHFLVFLLSLFFGLFTQPHFAATLPSSPHTHTLSSSGTRLLYNTSHLYEDNAMGTVEITLFASRALLLLLLLALGWHQNGIKEDRRYPHLFWNFLKLHRLVCSLTTCIGSLFTASGYKKKSNSKPFYWASSQHKATFAFPLMALSLS